MGKKIFTSDVNGFARLDLIVGRNFQDAKRKLLEIDKPARIIQYHVSDNGIKHTFLIQYDFIDKRKAKVQGPEVVKQTKTEILTKEK